MSKGVAKSANSKSGAMQSRAASGLPSLAPSDRENLGEQLLQLQGKAGNQAIQALLGSGKPLPDPERGEMETRFGTDFLDVRIHDNPLAHRSAKLLRAKAFTYGSDIVFGAGRFVPRSREGHYLLAHELAHVVQQRGRAPGPLSKARITQPDDAPERAADHAAQAIDMQSAVAIQPVASLPTLARTIESTLPWETAVETADEWWGKRKTAVYDFLIESIQNIKRERIAELRTLAGTLPESVQKIANPVIDAYEVALDISYSLVLGLVGLAVGLVSGIVHAAWGIVTGLLNLSYTIGALLTGILFQNEHALEEFRDRSSAFLEGFKQLGPNLVRLWDAWEEEFKKASPEKQSLMIGELTGQIEAVLLQALAGGMAAGKMPPLKVPARAFSFAGGFTEGGAAIPINLAGPGMAAALTVNIASQVEQKAKSAEKRNQAEDPARAPIREATKSKKAEATQTAKEALKTKSSDCKLGESPAEWSPQRAKAEWEKIKRKRTPETKVEPAPSGPPTSPEEAFGKLRDELGFDPPSTKKKPGGVKQAIKEAKPFPRGNRPGEISAEVQEHRHASEVREAFGVTGKDVQSAHGGASSWLNKRVWRSGKPIRVSYSRAEAITNLLPPEAHRSFDDFWKAFARDKRSSGITKVTVSEMLNVMREAVAQSKIPKGRQGPLITIIEKEIRDLGLLGTDVIELPFAKKL